VIQVYLVSDPWGSTSPAHQVLTLSAPRRALEPVSPDQRRERLRGVALDKLPGEESAPDERNDPAALIARSHNSDLQYLHGMATAANEDPLTTKGNMLERSRFMTDISTGPIGSDVKASDVALT